MSRAFAVYILTPHTFVISSPIDIRFVVLQFHGMYNDAVIANKVREAILLNPRVSAQDIMVFCQDRVVILSGDVDMPEQVRLVEESAERVEGVVRVVNNLHVRAGRFPPVEPEILPRAGGR